jgi:nucleoid DNA-binding protein
LKIPGLKEDFVRGTTQPILSIHAGGDTVSANTKSLTKAEVLNELAQRTGLTKSQVAGFFNELGSLIRDQLNSGGPGVLSIPGLMRVKVVRKPATPERKGINPFTKQETVFKARPARNVVKITPLKSLKDMV